MRIYTREESEFYRTAVITAVEVFEKRGFEYIHLPLYEPLSLQEKALGNMTRNSLTFRDFRTAELMALRLDFTTQVVRHVSLMRQKEFPLRFYYLGPVFEYTEGLEEKMETGVEILGDPSVNADAEVIAVLWDYLQGIGAKDMIVSVGHVGIVDKILSEVDEKDRRELREAFKEKNITFLGRTFGKESRAVDLVLKQGSFEVLEVLGDGFEKERKELEEVGRVLQKEGVEFIYDLTEVRDFPYYSGIVFEIFQRHMGNPIGGGGRYDRLSTVFGEEFPATGGVVYLSKLAP